MIDPILGNANASAGASTTAHAGNIASATSLPSNETAGALPGQHSAGVGALPGPAGETGVAVLPLEKSEPSLPSVPMQMLMAAILRRQFGRQGRK